MSEPFVSPGHFIRFVGWLREDGVFTPDRGWETPKITEPPRGCRDYGLELLDQRQVIVASVIPQVSAGGCRSRRRTHEDTSRARVPAMASRRCDDPLA